VAFKDFTSTLFRGSTVVGGTAYLTAAEGSAVGEIAVPRAPTGLDAAAFSKVRGQICSRSAGSLCNCSPVFAVDAL
jgi:hypothetical protein